MSTKDGGLTKRADVAGWTDEFIDTVFPAEYETIMARRREVTRREAEREGTEPQAPPDRSAGGPLVPSTTLRLFGLCFSGGGIRSATFNLGVTQALAKKGLLPRMDYLSTVSGGGYIGSCLSSLLNRSDADTTWSKAFPFYLESGRQEPMALRHLRNNSEFLVGRGTIGYFSILAILLRGILVNILALTPFIIAIVALTQLTYGAGLSGGLRGELRLSAFDITLGSLALFGVAVLLFPLLAWIIRQRSAHPIASTRGRFMNTYGLMLKLVVVVAIIEALPEILRWYDDTMSGRATLQGATWISLLGAVTPNKSSDGKPGVMSKMLDALKLVAVAAAGPLLLLIIYLVLGRWVVFPASVPAAVDPTVVQWAIYGTGVALLVYVLLFLDANATSIHQYYRDRLSRAYLFQVDPQSPSTVQSTDGLPMSRLNAEGTVAPYHLVNTTLNLQGSDDVNLRGRAADFFVLSKHYTGSIRTGYCPTTKMEAADHHLNLGTALAISGAAASPAMGTMTIRSLSLLMTLLNVRLGYWLINPRRAAAGQGGLLGNLGAGLEQLVAEAFNRADEHGRSVNVSDGAHIENLGMYELLRRRCRVIVCGDAEADPDMSFTGLATVIREAATDMGVHIDINLSGLQPDENGRSAQHHAIGCIDYGDGEVGWLLYIKLSIGKRELPYIEQYQSANPAFPHQSTADQFFDEAQFEAYRALGFKVGLRTMDALGELKEAMGDDGFVEYGLEVDGPESVDAADPMAGELQRRFEKAADSQPPW